MLDRSPKTQPGCRVRDLGRSASVLALWILTVHPQSAASGITLGPAVNVSNSPEPSGVAEVSPQGLAVDPEGRVIAVWNEFKDADHPPELALRVAGPMAVRPAGAAHRGRRQYSGEGALARLGWGDDAWISRRQFAIWIARIVSPSAAHRAEADPRLGGPARDGAGDRRRSQG
jgi:hypothetical protein